MAPASNRDIKNLRRKDLLDDYFERAKKRKGSLVATALRTRSVSFREILVHGALYLDITSEQLKSSLLQGQDMRGDIADVNAIAELGRLVRLQNMFEHDIEFGEKLLSLAHELEPISKLSRTNRRVFIQHHIAAGNHEIASRLLDHSSDIDREYSGYLRTEMINPFVFDNSTEANRWMADFNRPFEEYCLNPIALDDSPGKPFDRLRSVGLPVNVTASSDEPLISVVLTAYNPDESGLITSVRSILDQTWKNLELIIVDDYSASECREVFERIQNMDRRVKVIHSKENRGTYESRNVGYAVAQGAYITGQDDDDWSHPERLARQINYMNENPEAIGCRVTAVRCDEDLGRLRVGYHPLGQNASSLLIRREGYERTGGYLSARKAADTEFYYRVSAVTGRPIGDMREPLSIIRILPNSLSRGDFQPGWKHPSRRTFRSSYEHWHRNSDKDELFLSAESEPRVKIPRRFRASDASAVATDPTLDVVFAGDWQQYGGPQKSMLEEIYALKKAGLRIGVMNLEAGRFMSMGGQKPLNSQIQTLINEGFVDEVLYDEDICVRLLILRYPPILQFITNEPSSLRVDSMIILANQAPSELDGSDIRYLIPDCHKNAESVFGVEPLWVPQGPQVRKFLELYLEAPILAGFDLPGILNLDEWWHERLWYRSRLPVVGRHSRDNIMKWPAERAVLNEIYRPNGDYDVRIMGGGTIPLGVLGDEKYPPGWTVFKTDEMPVKDFLYSLDYFVFFPHPQAVEAFGRAILEALASGTVVILPKQFSEVFGDAAIYTEPFEVAEKIEYLHADFGNYVEQLTRARSALMDRFSYASYQHRIGHLLKVGNVEGMNEE